MERGHLSQNGYAHGTKIPEYLKIRIISPGQPLFPYNGLHLSQVCSCKCGENGAEKGVADPRWAE
jgi:hypothetical protein